MPWQRQVADVGLEIDVDTGWPAYRSVAFTVPRQSGKTLLLLGWECQRAMGWDGPQRIAYSAQTGTDARKKLIEDQVPLLTRHRRKLGIGRILKGMGGEAIEWMNGSRLVLLTTAESSGHGPTIDLGVKDELFADIDFRRDQALIPAMSTRAAGQILTASTAGTDASIALNRTVVKGRAAVDAGRRDGVAYFEWSAPEGVDPDDEDEWWRCMPALGHTIYPSVVRLAREDLDEPEFMRAYLNIPTGTLDGRVIPLSAWDAVNAAKVAPVGELVFALDCNPERTWVSIACCDREGRIELVEHHAGVARVAEIAERWSAPFAIDPGGPAGAFIPDLERAGVKVIEVGGREVAQACGAFFDAVVEGRVRVRRHPALDDAVAGARKRSSGDAWAWARRDQTVDVSPLVAVTLVNWVACHNVAPMPAIF